MLNVFVFCSGFEFENEFVFCFFVLKMLLFFSVKNMVKMRLSRERSNIVVIVLCIIVIVSGSIKIMLLSFNVICVYNVININVFIYFCLFVV